jgi:hypothetical protein
LGDVGCRDDLNLAALLLALAIVMAALRRLRYNQQEVLVMTLSPQHQRHVLKTTNRDITVL